MDYCSKLHHIAICEDGAIPVKRKVDVHVPRLNEHQISILQKSLAVHRYPNETSLKELAQQTGLHEVQVLQWLGQNRPKQIKLKRLRKLMENHRF